MAGFALQVKERAQVLKVLFKKGFNILGLSCKKSRSNVKNVQR